MRALIVFILHSWILASFAVAEESKVFQITVAGTVKNATHVKVTEDTKLSSVIKEAKGITVWGSARKLYIVRLIDSLTRDVESPPSDHKIIEHTLTKDKDPTMKDLKISPGDILYFRHRMWTGK